MSEVLCKRCSCAIKNVNKENKKCSGCKVIKDINHFSKYMRNGINQRQSMCKECFKAKNNSVKNRSVIEMDNETIEKIKDLREQGKPWKEISTELNVKNIHYVKLVHNLK